MTESLTKTQKLQALADRFYSETYISRPPKAGDYYCTARNDLELYQIVKIENGVVYTKYCKDENGCLSEWNESGFLSEGFGEFRIYVAPYVLDIIDDVCYSIRNLRKNYNKHHTYNCICCECMSVFNHNKSIDEVVSYMEGET